MNISQIVEKCVIVCKDNTSKNKVIAKILEYNPDLRVCITPQLQDLLYVPHEKLYGCINTLSYENFDKIKSEDLI